MIFGGRLCILKQVLTVASKSFKVLLRGAGMGESLRDKNMKCFVFTSFFTWTFISKTILEGFAFFDHRWKWSKVNFYLISSQNDFKIGAIFQRGLCKRRLSWKESRINEFSRKQLFRKKKTYVDSQISYSRLPWKYHIFWIVTIYFFSVKICTQKCIL